MIQPGESLLQYKTPVVVKSRDQASSKADLIKVSPEQPAETIPVPPPPKSFPNKTNKQQNEEILNAILPPREWMEDDQLWVQEVSTAPCTQRDLVHLLETLDRKLQQKKASGTGICPIRRELYSQCFDELIRQVTISCAERGLLLLRVRDEIQTTIAAYQTLYESSTAFGFRKALQDVQGNADMEKRICDLENEAEELKKHLDEQKAKYAAIEQGANERLQTEEQQHTEAIQFLKKSNQQLKSQLEGIIAPKT